MQHGHETVVSGLDSSRSVGYLFVWTGALIEPSIRGAVMNYINYLCPPSFAYQLCSTCLVQSSDRNPLLPKIMMMTTSITPATTAVSRLLLAIRLSCRSFATQLVSQPNDLMSNVRKCCNLITHFSCVSVACRPVNLVEHSLTQYLPAPFELIPTIQQRMEIESWETYQTRQGRNLQFH